MSIRRGHVGPPLMVTVTGTVGLTSGHTEVSLRYAGWAEKAPPLRFDEAEFNEVRWCPFDQAPFDRSNPNPLR